MKGLIAVAAVLVAQTTAVRPLVPVDAVTGIVDAFHSYQIVGISPGEGHGDQRGPAFIVSLVRDARFAAVANDIVMEGASGRHQDAMDRYVNGESVSDAELRPIWDDTTQQQVPGPIWTGEVPPIYRAVREVNTKLPRERRLRLLLGDPPIEWENVHTPADYRKWLEQRDAYPATLIEREVIAKHRRALVSFGGGHLQRRQQLTNYQMEDPLAQTVISLVEHSGTSTFIIRNGSDRQGIHDWPVPSLALLRGTALGAADEPADARQRFTVRNGTIVPIPRADWIAIPLEQQTDALLYLGPSSAKTEAPLPQSICRDGDYVQKRLQRMAIAGLPPSEPARLKQLCGLP